LRNVDASADISLMLLLFPNKIGTPCIFILDCLFLCFSLRDQGGVDPETVISVLPDSIDPPWGIDHVSPSLCVDIVLGRWPSCFTFATSPDPCLLG
jgi:hypothetical protein